MANTLKETFAGYGEHKVSKMSASLAYYAIFSMGPIVLILITILGLVFGQQAGGQLEGQIAQWTSPRIASFVQMIVQNTNVSQDSIISFIVAGLLLIVGATSVVADMQDSLNTIWGVRKNKDAGLIDTLMVRVRAFIMIVVTAAVLLAALLLTTLLPSFMTQLEETLGLPGFALQLISYGASMVLFWILFMILFKYLPDVEAGFRDVWFGALITAILFVVGQWLISMYLGRSEVSQQFGPAGAAIAFLLWIYYSAQVFYLGAEFTRSWYQRSGRRVKPIHHTELVRHQPQPVR